MKHVARKNRILGRFARPGMDLEEYAPPVPTEAPAARGGLWWWLAGLAGVGLVLLAVAG